MNTADKTSLLAESWVKSDLGKGVGMWAWFILKVVQSVMGNGPCHNVLNNQPAIPSTLRDQRPRVRLGGRVSR